MLYVEEADTITFYENHAVDFVKNTREVDFKATQMRFLKKLNSGAHILDFGCGSGRDTRFFIDQGYQVSAMDGAKELCRLASEYTKIPVEHRKFEELNEIAVYDGIWACSSILHVPIAELQGIFRRMAAALKEKGIVYTSFKYGEFEGMRNGRYFTDMTEAKLETLLEIAGAFTLEEQWITSDVRPGREEEKWLNLILRKI